MRKQQPLGYGNTDFQTILTKYKEKIQSESIVIIGTIEPWIEALVYELEASRIVTLDYTRKTWHEKKLEWYHVNDYLEGVLKSRDTEEFTNAATYSSIEHSGLGRFGDPLNPNGDLDAMKQVHCMMKPGGLFFLGGLDNYPQEKGEIQFNAHRIYGTKRLGLLFEGWNVHLNDSKKAQFVLQKEGCN